MQTKLIIHTKSGKTIVLPMEPTDASLRCIQYSDWLATGDETDAPLVDETDRFGHRVVVPFANVEYMEIEGR